MNFTAADRSICPTAVAGLAAAGRPPGAAPAFGLGALGIGGFPGGLGAPGFAPTGGGFGFVATGGPGGLGANELEGRELGAESVDAGGFFHGVADPLEDPMPGNTETGFAEASAETELSTGLGAATDVGRALDGGGGGGGAGAAFGGTSSR